MTRGGNHVDDRHTHYRSPGLASAPTWSPNRLSRFRRIVAGARAAAGPHLRRIRVGAPTGWTAVDTCAGAAPGRGTIGHSAVEGRDPDHKILHTVVIDNAVGHVNDDIEVQLAGRGATGLAARH